MPDDPTPEPEPAIDAEVVDGEVVDGEVVEPEPAATVPVEPVDTGYTPGGVPTFESVREKIDTRYFTAIGAAELDAESGQGRSVAEQYDERQRAAAERLDRIREQMRQSGESQ